ncbi:MAG: RNA methyltransferase [Rhodospirillales bacterium]|nr:RNA methyltransferase [Rhodospirillales bacterium]MDE2199384.1 RNA methyltransferase [Rhodospirillales bacterium]MDE2576676.1 RNA methyltransferase [Rhodospirillales bacterium]
MKHDTICGANAVAAVFARRPAEVLRLFYVPAQRPLVGEWCAVLAAAKKPYRMVEAEELATIAGTTHHGGVVVAAKPRVPAILDLAALPRCKLLLVLDGIGNPHNLGAIARSAAFFGVKALLLGEGLGHAMPSDAAYRTAEGGLEFLDLYRTRDLPRALGWLEPHYRSVAASLGRAAAPLADLPRDRPVALVLGNEETGVSPAVLAACRREVRIAGSGRVQSLNVAQAAAVLLHELTG